MFSTKVEDSFILDGGPKNISTTDHLTDAMAELCLNGTQRPVNPHRQRLLSAAAPQPQVDAKNRKEAPKAAAKAAAKGKAKAKAKACAVSASKKKADGEEVKALYNNAKKQYMAGFLN